MCVCVCERERESLGSRSTCVTPGERLRQSLRKQTKNEVARRGLRFQKKSLQGLLPGRETPHFFFLTAHEHWRCVHVDVREVRDNCGFAHPVQGQIMNLSQISGLVPRNLRTLASLHALTMGSGPLLCVAPIPATIWHSSNQALSSDTNLPSNDL